MDERQMRQRADGARVDYLQEEVRVLREAIATATGKSRLGGRHPCVRMVVLCLVVADQQERRGLPPRFRDAAKRPPAYIPPTLREDAGEVGASESGRLPPPLPALNGDFHVRTSVSGDAVSPLEDVVRAAQARGYRALAIAEHAEGTRAGVSRAALLAQAEQIRAQQSALGDQMLLPHGVELNIGPAGELDYYAEFRGQFAFCLASVHSHFELDRSGPDRANRARHARPLRAHDRPSDSAQHLQPSGHRERLDLSVEALRLARQRRVPLVSSSDAHHQSELGRIQYAALQAERAGVDPAQIVNTWPAPRLHDWLAAKVPLATPIAAGPEGKRAS